MVTGYMYKKKTFFNQMTLGLERVQNQRDGDTFNKTFFSDKYECGIKHSKEKTVVILNFLESVSANGYGLEIYIKKQRKPIFEKLNSKQAVLRNF